MRDLYRKILAATDYLKDYPVHPNSIKEVAKKLDITSDELDELFKNWAGTGVKEFFKNLQKAKKGNDESKNQLSLFDSTANGSIQTGQIHKSFVKILPMSAEEFALNYQNLHINYSFSESPFGNLIIASTEKGVCFLALEEDREEALNQLREKYPNAELKEGRDSFQENALRVFDVAFESIPEITLHLDATEFQFIVWNALLEIPFGKLVTYHELATQIGRPEASRATGTAIGSNSVAFLIPCHRVIRSTGETGNFKWGGTAVKTSIIGWEVAKMNPG